MVGRCHLLLRCKAYVHGRTLSFMRSSSILSWKHLEPPVGGNSLRQRSPSTMVSGTSVNGSASLVTFWQQELVMLGPTPKQPRSVSNHPRTANRSHVTAETPRSLRVNVGPWQPSREVAWVHSNPKRWKWDTKIYVSSRPPPNATPGRRPEKWDYWRDHGG